MDRIEQEFRAAKLIANHLQDGRLNTVQILHWENNHTRKIDRYVVKINGEFVAEFDTREDAYKFLSGAFLFTIAKTTAEIILE